MIFTGELFKIFKNTLFAKHFPTTSSCLVFVAYFSIFHSLKFYGCKKFAKIGQFLKKMDKD